MDLISREKAIRVTIGMTSETGINEAPIEYAESNLKRLPSAFEGMTNGEVIKAVFPSADVEYWAEYSTYIINFPNDNDVKHFSFSWWNAPYKGDSK